MSDEKAAVGGEVGESKKQKEASCCHKSHMFGGQPWQLGTMLMMIFFVLVQSATYVLVD